MVINEVEMRRHDGGWYLETERLHGVADDAGLDPPHQ